MGNCGYPVPNLIIFIIPRSKILRTVEESLKCTKILENRSLILITRIKQRKIGHVKKQVVISAVAIIDLIMCYLKSNDLK